MEIKSKNIPDLSVKEAYLIYKVRSHPELWNMLNKYIKPDGTVRTEAEARRLTGKEAPTFKVEE